MKLHTDFAAPGFALPAVDPTTGPFPGPVFLSAWWRHRGHGELLLAESGDGLLALTRVGREIALAGDADVTDYHCPLGPGSAELVTAVARHLGGDAIWRCDSLPAAAAEVVECGLVAAGRSATVRQDAVCAVVELPADYDGYLKVLGNKQRHELRRKRRRFESQLGSPVLTTGREYLDEFVALHRQSAGRKGSFMSADMAAFFSSLLAVPGARIDVLRAGSGKPAAAAFAFADDDTYYLYNSGYDPQAGAASPGQVMVGLLIEQSIDEGRRRFDFLKGDESYKFRLGAQPRPLYTVAA